MFSDDQFQEELAHVVKPVVGSEASLLSGWLSRAYHPDTRRRPPEVPDWAEDVAGALGLPVEI